MAYLPFPKNWPKYSSKDKLADWLEAYAKIMELNIWLSTKIQTAKYDDAKMGWTVHLTRAGNELVLRPKHIIWCGGLAGVPKMPNFPGQSQFNGMIYHASQHTDASQYNPAGKKVVVVGTGNSGHDISQDFCEHGAEVTMVQRRGTYVLTAEKGLPLLPESLGLEDNRYVIIWRNLTN
jgi:cation diffusion facilitator CzcD-associated flavoprotein CzcO